MHINESVLILIMGSHCVECGKKPCNASPIIPFDQNGPHQYFNLIPLCVKHCHEHVRLGTIAMADKYSNIKLMIENKGWTFGNKLTHRDIKGEN